MSSLFGTCEPLLRLLQLLSLLVLQVFVRHGSLGYYARLRLHL